MKSQVFSLALLLLAVGCVSSSPTQTVAPTPVAVADVQSPTEIKAVYIGHSLESDIPDMVSAIAGGRLSFKEQNIPGAPLRWQWEEAERRELQPEPTFQGIYDTIITADTDVLVLIDSVPRGNEESLLESIEYTGKFVDFARSKNPDIQVYYYEPWHHVTTGTPQNSEYDKGNPNRVLRWRPRLKADHELWQRVVRDVNSAHPGGKPVRLIPAGLALAALSEAIEKGEVPGLDEDRDLFDDDIHLQPIGKYFVSCVHYAVLFEDSPSGKPWDIKNRWGQPYYDVADWAGKTWPKPNQETARALQQVAARAVLGG